MTEADLWQTRRCAKCGARFTVQVWLPVSDKDFPRITEHTRFCARLCIPTLCPECE